jgi:diadenosine tetraphosphate (Ap4A) HIT family hydrolase
MNDKTAFIENREGMVVYSDPIAHVVLPERPATMGHVRVYSKQAVARINDLDDEAVTHLYHVASIVASMLFELIDAGGTNIILNEGRLFNQHLHIDIIARNEDDDLDLRWDGRELPDATMDDVRERIEDGFHADDDRTQERETTTETETVDETDYRLQRLNRMP